MTNGSGGSSPVGQSELASDIVSLSSWIASDSLGTIRWTSRQRTVCASVRCPYEPGPLAQAFSVLALQVRFDSSTGRAPYISMAGQHGGDLIIEVPYEHATTDVLMGQFHISFDNTAQKRPAYDVSVD